MLISAVFVVEGSQFNQAAPNSSHSDSDDLCSAGHGAQISQIFKVWLRPRIVQLPKFYSKPIPPGSKAKSSLTNDILSECIFH